MIMASILNESGNESVLLPSKSTIHHQRQQNRIEIAKGIKLAFSPTKVVAHWDGKLLPNMSDKEPWLTDCQYYCLQLLMEQLSQSGMCFDTTASNTGKFM